MYIILLYNQSNLRLGIGAPLLDPEGLPNARIIAVRIIGCMSCMAGLTLLNRANYPFSHAHHAKRDSDVSARVDGETS